MPLHAVQSIPNRKYLQSALSEGYIAVVDERLVGGIGKGGTAQARIGLHERTTHFEAINLNRDGCTCFRSDVGRLVIADINCGSS